MRTLLYNFSVLILRSLLPVMAGFSPKIKRFHQGRKKLLQNIENDLTDNKAPLFWVHCSSVGEFEQGLPVIELLKKEHPSWKVIITFFSPSGFEAINNKIIDYKYYLPYDTAKNAQHFIALIKPKFALFIKYEFWFHFLNQLKKNQIATYSVSSIFRPAQPFFKWYGGWNRIMLTHFTHFMVQDEASSTLLQSINIKATTITGDTRFDRVLKLKEDKIKFKEIENFIDDKKVFIIGSLRNEDDEVIFDFIKSTPEFTFIIAPHDITEKHIAKIEQALPSSVRHSQLTDKGDSKILIIDSIGKLSRLYRLADFAYIGGGFSDGIHNILEPAVYNIPIFFGNQQYKKYKEANDLVDLGAAFPIANANQLKEALNKLQDTEKLLTTKKKIEAYIKSNQGAAHKVVNVINQQVAI